MLTKEYRICLPMSVEEYRIAQLYMIQKKSREESEGAGSGVEIMVNEPYKDGPGGNGQYTYKIYHIGSHLPGWFRAILPKSALRVEEEAWNAYPYTKTIYRCPFIEKFTLEIETKYQSDGGEQDNIFNLSNSELRSRTIDYLDIVKDPISSGDYRKEEDPVLFKSSKTNRGPLEDAWREEYTVANKNPRSGKKIMCAYKLCRVEFRYWGMQTKIERFIHDIGLRKTMLRAHRQAWCWQDEYYGLTIDDIRELERQTQAALQEKMAQALADENGEVRPSSVTSSPSKDQVPLPALEAEVSSNGNVVTDKSPRSNSPYSNSRQSMAVTYSQRKSSADGMSIASRKSIGSSRNIVSAVETLEQLQTYDSDDDEFFDAQEALVEEQSPPSYPGLYRSSSMEMLTSVEDFTDATSAPPPAYAKAVVMATSSVDSTQSPLDRRVEQFRLTQGGQNIDLSQSMPNSPLPGTMQGSCKTTFLFLALHGGSIMDTGSEAQFSSKHSEISTLKNSLETVISAHYPAMMGHIAVRLVSCPAVCAEALNLLASLNPFSFEAKSPSVDRQVVAADTLPLGAISLFVTGSPEYFNAVSQVIARCNATYNDFLRSEEGVGFNGQVCMIGDSVGSILAYDALCKNNPFLYSRNSSRYGSHSSLNETEDSETDSQLTAKKTVIEPEPHHVSKKTNLETIRQVSFSNPDIPNVECNDVTGPGQQNSTSNHTPAPPAPAPAKQLSRQSDTQGSQRSNSGGEHSAHTSESHGSVRRTGSGHHHGLVRHTSSSSSRRTSTGSNSGELGKLDFDVTDLFTFGSPLPLVLAYRKTCQQDDKSNPLPRPACHQIYNMFYPSDPSAVRLEPLLQEKFRHVAPMKVARYEKFPLGDGQSVHVVEAIQSHAELFGESVPQSAHSYDGHPPALERRQSNQSIMSQMSGHAELSIATITAITARWWGNKRLDYALYHPEALSSFPSTALPYLLHASFWESTDVASFILRQVVRQEFMTSASEGNKDVALFKPSQPREKWLKRRTTIKLRNVAPNHRANDVIVLEDKPQVFVARFMYGPLDMVSLSGEKVDIHVMTKPPVGDWICYGTETTDSGGRVTFTIPKEKQLPQGMYPIKMVVRGDHTSVDFYMTVLPPKTECVVFSIDGSFTASVSIMGKDPKVRAGAVDVVRHWQELGYLILYITARPDMQQKKVVAWLAQHNFPHGLVSFMDGMSYDPIRQKANYLKGLVAEAKIQVYAAYGSQKDVAVYQAIDLQPEQIFIVGKANKKTYKEAMVISDGYAAHLSELAAHGACRPASGNARMFIRRSCFSLPGQHRTQSKKTVRKTVSLPYRGSTKDSKFRDKAGSVETSIIISDTGTTKVEPGLAIAGTAAPARGSSPRVKVNPFSYQSDV